MNLETFGRKISQKDSEKLLKSVNELLNNSNKRKFPGYQPISLMRFHIKDLLEEDYLVCEKTDGIRALLYICKIEGRIFGFYLDRKNIFYKLDIVFPNLENTLFDGEVIVDRENQDGQNFIICDCMSFNNVNITNLPYVNRLGYAIKFIGMYESISKNAKIKIVLKEIQKSYGLLSVYEKSKMSKHDSDGLIFTPVNSPYRSGTSVKLLKWKPPHLNSVDFVIRKSRMWDDTYDLLCINKYGDLSLFDHYFIPLDESNEERKYFYSIDNDSEVRNIDKIQNSLCEFRFSREKYTYDIVDLTPLKGGWEFIRIRCDKNTANSIYVVINVMNSIDEDIKIENLTEHIPEIRKSWKSRESKRSMKNT